MNSSQLVLKVNPAPLSVCPDAMPGVRVCAAKPFRTRSLKTRRASAPLDWLKLSVGFARSFVDAHHANV